MKNISSFLIAILAYGFAFSQQHPVNDTLIPKQHKDDTLISEPKLQGGALIDTVNIKDKPTHHPQYLDDTLKEKSKPEKSIGKIY